MNRSNGRTQAVHGLLVRHIRHHAVTFVAVNALLIVVGLVTGGRWWSYWVFITWAILLALHYFYVKSVSVDDGWVAERTEELRTRSYDLGHIENIKDRVKKDDPTVRPADKRK